MEFFCPPAEAPQWHEYWLAERMRWYLDLGMKPENLRLRAHERRRALALLGGHQRRRVPLPLGLGRAGRHRQPHRLRPQGPRRGQRPGPALLRPGPRGALLPLRDRAVGGDHPLRLRLPHRRLRRGGGARGEAGGAAPAPPAGAHQGGGAAAVQEGRADGGEPRGGRHAAGPLAGGARRHPVDRPPLPPPGRDRHPLRRHRGLRHASQDRAVTIRERDTMEQVRVPIAGLVETLQEKFAGSL